MWHLQPPPTLARTNAQLKQMIRQARCVHPEHALVLRMTTDGGFIEYCSDCDKVTDNHFPTYRRREVK